MKDNEFVNRFYLWYILHELMIWQSTVRFSANSANPVPPSCMLHLQYVEVTKYQNESATSIHVTSGINKALKTIKINSRSLQNKPIIVTV